MAAAVAAAAMIPTAYAQNGSRGLETIPADQARVTGSVVVDFGSRKEKGSGVDLYTLENLTVADLMILNGTIQRAPEKSLTYSVKFDVFNPAQPGQIAREVAILRGDVKINDKGAYLPGDLRLDVVKGATSASRFGGTLQGREVTRWWEVKEQFTRAQDAAKKLYTRYVDGKPVTIEVKTSEPLDFQNVSLAAGPFSYLPDTTVSGKIDYDYELGNWLVDSAGLKFSYASGDKSLNDKVTGSIRYSDVGGTQDFYGKSITYTSSYEYALRWNEAVEGADQSFFEGTQEAAEVDSFFSSNDQTKPGLYGRVYFNDSEDGCRKVKDKEGKEACVGPTRSEITYDLKAVGLTYAQLAAWMKLEQLTIGAFTDE